MIHRFFPFMITSIVSTTLDAIPVRVKSTDNPTEINNSHHSGRN